MAKTNMGQSMPIPNQAVVKPIIDEIRDEIVAAIHEAWDDWMASDYVAVWRCKRSRANFVWEQIVDRAHAALMNFENVHIIEATETMKFLIHDQVLFRFKKADEAGRTANVATQMAMAFHDHDQDLFGLPEVQRVEVVYKLNKLETAIADICVVARNGDAVTWEYSLLDAESVVAPLPVPEPEPVRSAAKIVKLKGVSDERKKRDK
ncbi:hypothetical protein [uncultured Tateyamaria sp.]|uniref:hypothetical protein n=1 Tax=uncultured Tateyamaria sp. TaxID=455651 RepID=UPI00260AE64F|nr:hypothetical protein [uncultured Tateyamaria sp.]